MKHVKVQLKDHVTGQAIITAGGVCGVHVAGSGDKVALLDSTGASASNPSTLTRGLIEFYVANTVTSVDLHIMTPGGQFLSVFAMDPGASPNEVSVDTGRRDQVAYIPFSHADSTAATEQDTGFDLPTDCMVSPDGLGLYINTVDATETIDVGILSTEANGDANGFIAVGSVATAGAVQAEVGFTVGTNSVVIDLTGGDAEFTYGALMCAAASIDAKAEGTDVDTEANGIALLKRYRCDGTAVSISYTTTAGSDTCDGFIVVPYRLMA